MNPIRLRKPKLEAVFFRILDRWNKAVSDDQYSSENLSFLWGQLEYAWRQVGYTFGRTPPEEPTEVVYEYDFVENELKL